MDLDQIDAILDCACGEASFDLPEVKDRMLDKLHDLEVAVEALRPSNGRSAADEILSTVRELMLWGRQLFIWQRVHEEVRENK